MSKKKDSADLVFMILCGLNVIMHAANFIYRVSKKTYTSALSCGLAASSLLLWCASFVLSVDRYTSEN